MLNASVSFFWLTFSTFVHFTAEAWSWLPVDCFVEKETFVKSKRKASSSYWKLQENYKMARRSSVTLILLAICCLASAGKFLALLSYMWKWLLSNSVLLLGAKVKPMHLSGIRNRLYELCTKPCTAVLSDNRNFAHTHGIFHVYSQHAFLDSACQSCV